MVHTFKLLFMLILMSSCNQLIDVLSNKSGSPDSIIIPPASFVSTWRVGDTSYGDGDTTVTLPLRSGYTYDLTVYWGDGTAVQTVIAFDDANIDHAYSDPGDNDKIISVTNLGSVGWTMLESAFAGCSKLESFSGGNTSAVTDMQSMFSGVS